MCINSGVTDGGQRGVWPPWYAKCKILKERIIQTTTIEDSYGVKRD